MVSTAWAHDGLAHSHDAASSVVTLQSSSRLKTADRPEQPDGPVGQPDGRYTADWDYQ